MSWKFHNTHLLMYVRCDESSLYSRINYVHSPDGELQQECPGIIKNDATQGLARTRIALCQRLVLTRKKLDVMI